MSSPGPQSFSFAHLYSASEKHCFVFFLFLFTFFMMVHLRGVRCLSVVVAFTLGALLWAVCPGRPGVLALFACDVLCFHWLFSSPNWFV